MPIEKVFAINARPHDIFAALERDLDAAIEHQGTTHEVLAKEPDRSLELRVTIGGIPCLLRYTLEPSGGATEVTATLNPYGWRYGLFRTITFGLRDSNFAVTLVQSLANLKAAVEAESGTVE